MRKYWVSGIFVENGKAFANWLSEPCMSKKQAAHAIRVWVDHYGCVSAIIKEENPNIVQKRVVFAGNFINFIGARDTEALDRFEQEVENESE